MKQVPQLSSNNVSCSFVFTCVGCVLAACCLHQMQRHQFAQKNLLRIREFKCGLIVSQSFDAGQDYNDTITALMNISILQLADTAHS